MEFSDNPIYRLAGSGTNNNMADRRGYRRDNSGILQGTATASIHNISLSRSDLPIISKYFISDARVSFRAVSVRFRIPPLKYETV